MHIFGAKRQKKHSEALKNKCISDKYYKITVVIKHDQQLYYRVTFVLPLEECDIVILNMCFLWSQ